MPDLFRYLFFEKISKYLCNFFKGTIIGSIVLHKEAYAELGIMTLGGYRPISYIGFAIGTIYQYALLRIMVDIVFKDVEGIPVYKFDFPVMLISLIVFIMIYEILMHVYSEKIKRISTQLPPAEAGGLLRLKSRVLRLKGAFRAEALLLWLTVSQLKALLK